MTRIEISGNKIRKFEYILVKTIKDKVDTLITSG